MLLKTSFPIAIKIARDSLIANAVGLSFSHQIARAELAFEMQMDAKHIQGLCGGFEEK